MYRYRRLSLDNDAERRAGLFLVGQHGTTGKRPVMRIAHEIGQFLLRQHGEQRDLGKDRFWSCHGLMHLSFSAASRIS